MANSSGGNFTGGAGTLAVCNLATPACGVISGKAGAASAVLSVAASNGISFVGPDCRFIGSCRTAIIIAISSP